MRYLAALLVLAQTASANINGTWTAELHNAEVFLQLRATAPDDGGQRGTFDGWSGSWNTGQSVPADTLGGLPANDDHLTAANITFEWRREAGTVAFEGAFRDGRGAGLFTFSPRNEFTAEMKAIGYTDDLPLWRRFQFAVHDVGPKYIRALKAEGYDALTLDQIQRAKTHGVSIDYIKSMKAEGYKVAAIEDIVRTRDHGVTAEYVKTMRGAGFEDATFEDLVRAKDHGVKADYVRELRSQGISSTTLDGFVRLRDHGVTADYITDMKGVGLKSLTAEDLVRLHDHGVTPGFVNHVRAQGYKEDTPDGLIQLKNRGTWRR